MLNDIQEIIMTSRKLGVSDIHISEGMEMRVRIDGNLIPAPFEVDMGSMKDLVFSLLNPIQKTNAINGEDVDTAFQTMDGHRQRVNVFHQRGRIAATVRLLNNTIPTIEQLGLPQELKQLAVQPRGFVLITGPTGSGKSTTLASMIDYINQNQARHVITIEDPVEYTYKENKCLIHQREIGEDVDSFTNALRSALREDPDVILVGEMRDYETIQAAITAAETGHLVFSTLHTTGAAASIDRIIDACPGSIQNQVRIQLASVLRGVVTQCLIPHISGQGRVVATEVMMNTDAISNMIRENKGHPINASLQAGAMNGMHTLNGDLARLVRNRSISIENALAVSNDPKELRTLIR